MLPVLAASFSSPPMRCSRPGVPGMAQGRARCSSRRYGQNSPSGAFGSVANFGSMSGRALTSGSFHGSDEFARNVSVSRITGVRYSMAIRAASSAASKHVPQV
jgi:hypothetical protein